MLSSPVSLGCMVLSCRVSKVSLGGLSLSPWGAFLAV